ncbi:MAG: transglutaminase-like domain-containing protein [Gemmataceae bacterium]
MNLDTVLPLLAENPDAAVDLAEVALLIARDEYPQLDVEAELAEVAAMAREVKPRLRGPLSVQVDALCRYLFHEQGFCGNQRDYYDPRNSYLNDVLSRRTGLPITLSVVAIAVGTRAGLEVAGVGLPGHFIAKAVQRGQTILFDPFHGGQLLSLPDCEALVERVTGVPFEANTAALAAASPGYVVQRMLTNLKGVYLQLRDYARVARVIDRLWQLCPDDPTQRRDLGVALLQAGRPGPAIDHLRAYVGGDPPPVDGGTIRELLQQAEGAVARWN